MWLPTSIKLLRISPQNTLQFQVLRHRSRARAGKPPTVALNLSQRLEKLNPKDPTIDFEVDIGFAHTSLSKKQCMQLWMKEMKSTRNNPALERKSRNQELLIDLDKVHENWLSTTAPIDNEKIARHYGIFKDLYGDAYFKPILPLQIQYTFEDLCLNVCRGNIFKPSETHSQPSIQFESAPEDLWTLVMTTPDANFSDPTYEYCHWFIGNIRGNDITKGEQLIDYLQPFPPYGIGYCRYIFVLYKQTKLIDYKDYRTTQPCLDLQKRNWKTYDFYRKYEDDLTPAGLGFFQASWEESLIDFYHNTLNMKHPKFQYGFPEKFVRKQEWFPHKEPFNLYLDRYRDPKQINKEYLLEKLKTVHPFKYPEPPLKYPGAQPVDLNLPSWYRLEIKKNRSGWGRINDIENVD